MASAHAGGFVQDLAIVLTVAGATGLAARRAGQPAILGYLLAGLVVGPYVPVPLFADAARVQQLSDFGVVLVMFAIGLEFRVARLVEVIPRAGLAALLQMGALAWCGTTLAGLLGWTPLEGLLLGGSMAISSTMVLTKVLEEQPLPEATTRLVQGILVLQDVVAIGLLAAFTGLQAGGSPSFRELALVEGKVALFLVCLATAGMFFVPALVRYAAGTGNDEALLMVAGGAAFGFADLATSAGYSPALGAFVAGMLVAESGERVAVEHLIAPLKNLFGAVFFVSVGMAVDPRLVAANAGPVLLVAITVVLAQLGSVGFGALLSGAPLPEAVAAGLALGQMGEFSFLIAAVGIQAGLARLEFAPVVVGAAVLTSFTTPALLARATPVAGALGRRLPGPARTALAVYQAWLERVRHAPAAPRSRLRRVAGALVLDGGLLVGGALAFLFWRRAGGTNPAVLAGAALLAVPLVGAYLRNTRTFAHLVVEAVPRAAEEGDPGAAGGVVRTGVTLASLLGVGLPAAALLRPWLGGPYVAPVLAVGTLLALVTLRRRSDALHEEVVTGVFEVIRQVAASSRADRVRHHPGAPGSDAVDLVVTIELGPEAPAVGKTLTELAIRAHTGATVVALRRGEEDMAPPPPDLPLAEDDVLAVLGTHPAMEAAARRLAGDEHASED